MTAYYTKARLSAAPLAAMGIEVQLRSEAGEVLRSVDDASGHLAKAAGGRRFDGTNLLRYLVPWSDAIFNQAQSSDLLADIRAVNAEAAGTPLGDHLEKLAPLIEQLGEEVHSYLWFVGD